MAGEQAGEQVQAVFGARQAASGGWAGGVSCPRQPVAGGAAGPGSEAIVRLTTSQEPSVFWDQEQP